MDFTKTLWKELIEKTLVKLEKFPIKIGRIYDKYQSLRIDYHWIEGERSTLEVDNEIENILLDAEAESEKIYYDKYIAGEKKQSFTFKKSKTFFGLEVYAYGVKRDDIEKLPFYDFWKDSTRNITYATIGDNKYVYLEDWEQFCRVFILTGKQGV